MKTITITQKLAEEILYQLEGAQKDCYVQSTENVINDLKQAISSMTTEKSNAAINFDQWVYWETNSHGYSVCKYYIQITYNGTIYKEEEFIVTNGRTMEDIKSQILISRKRNILKLIEIISDDISVPNIKEEIL